MKKPDFLHRLSTAFHIIRSTQTGGIRSYRPADYSAQKLLEFPSITPQEIADARAFFPLDKFFIFGHARSGTTLLVRLVRLHPHVHCNYQAHFFSRPPFIFSLVDDPQIRQWLARYSNRWNRGSDLSPLVLRTTADFILERDARYVEDQPGQVRVVGDKSPNNLTNGAAVQLMHKIYPDARLVFIVRDGRDAILSHRIQSFIEFPEQLTREDLRIRDDFSKNPNLFLQEGDSSGVNSLSRKSIFTEKNLRSEATSWVRNVTETDEAGKALYGKHFYTLRYEDLLHKPWEEMARLWHFLGVEPDQPGLVDALKAELSSNPDAEYQQEKAGEITQALVKGKRGSWKDFFTNRDQQVFTEIAGEALGKWQYEN